MTKQQFLKIVTLINTDFKGKFAFITEVTDIIRTNFGSVYNTIMDKISYGASISVTNTDIDNSLDPILTTSQNDIDNAKSVITNNVNNDFETFKTTTSNKTTDLITTTIVDSNITDSVNNATTEINDLINSLKDQYTIRDYFDTKVAELTSTKDLYLTNLYANIDKMGLYVGETDEDYWSLPKKFPNGNPVGLNDVAYLGKDDGTFLKGLYKWNGTEYVPYNHRRPITRIELKALIKKYYLDRDNEIVKDLIINANTSYVKDMSNLFYIGAGSDFSGPPIEWDFNLDISNWDTSNVTDMSFMFDSCTSFNQDISKWNTASVTDMTYMFSNANSFNQDISSWNVSSVTNMRGMFSSANSFNQDISNWITSKVTDMSYMFSGASSFNSKPPRIYYKTTTTRSMFYNCISFNQPFDRYLNNTAYITDASYMFSSCVNFNQDISGLSFIRIESCYNFAKDSALTSENIPQIIKDKGCA